MRITAIHHSDSFGLAVAALADLLFQIGQHNDLPLTRLISRGRTFCQFLLFEMVDRRNATECLITASNERKPSECNVLGAAIAARLPAYEHLRCGD
jgi:hypothetical protein